MNGSEDWETTLKRSVPENISSIVVKDEDSFKEYTDIMDFEFVENGIILCLPYGKTSVIKYENFCSIHFTIFGKRTFDKSISPNQT